MRDGQTPVVAPWSFFLPVALAVLVGGVTAGLILRGFDDGSDSDKTEPVVTAADSAAEESPASTASIDPPRAELDPPAGASLPVEASRRAQDPAPPAASSESDAAEGALMPVPSLPGAIVARRDGAPEACIGGTVAWRDENGWQQRLENDAPVACVEASALAQ